MDEEAFSSKNPARSNELDAMLDAVFDRIALHTIKTDYAADLRTLQDYLVEASTLRDFALVSKAWNTMGMLFLAVGRFDEAEGALKQSGIVAAAADYHYGQIRAASNLGVAYTDQGAYQRAIEQSLRVLWRIRVAQLEDSYVISIHLNTLGNMAFCYILLHAFDDAQRIVEAYFTLCKEPALQRLDPNILAASLRLIAYVRARLLIAQGAYVEAQREITEMMNMSQYQEVYVFVIDAYFLQLLLTISNPHSHTSASVYWNAIDTQTKLLIARHDSCLWAVGNHNFLQWAFEFEWLGQHNWAMLCARQALDILGLLGDDKRCAVAQALLNKLEVSDKQH